MSTLDLTNAISKAKSWELGTVRTTTTGKKILVVNPNVEITVGGRKIDLGEYNTLYFDGIDDVISYKEGLVVEGKLQSEDLSKFKERVSAKRISQSLRGKFVD